MSKGNQSKNTLITFILGLFCLDKLYTAKSLLGKIGWTVLKIITGGGLAIWWLVDLIMCVVGKYKVNPIDYFK
ncbi:MAG: TM2 domain-containing protein [Firmicutes bacterium]|nr:TM2 domain-containing protein [Bacillota bacterium]